MTHEQGLAVPGSQQEAHLRQSLRAAGLRATPQRLLLLSILEQSGRHLDAQELHSAARRQMPNINLATVYRVLDALKRHRLVRQQYFGRDHKRELFESASSGEHYHFTCLGCGAVVEFSTALIEQAQQELAASLGITFTHACVCFEGYCQECARERSDRSGAPANHWDDLTTTGGKRR